MQLRLISYKNLDSFTQRIMQKLNVSKEDAEIVADNLVLSNLRGIDSHGVARLQRYVDGIKTGYIIPDAKGLNIIRGVQNSIDRTGKEKTKGNCTDEEGRTLSKALTELRMNYVDELEKEE